MQKRRKLNKRWCGVVLLMCLPACVPKQEISICPQAAEPQPGISINTCNNDNQIDVYEAKWSDAPLPLDTKRDRIEVKEGTDALSCVFAFTAALSSSECLDFYRCQMERLGWQEGICFSFVPDEMVLIYEKPSKRAVITIRSCVVNPAESNVRLYVGIKQQGHDIRALVDEAEKIKN